MAKVMFRVPALAIVLGVFLLAGWVSLAGAAERVIYMQAMEPKGTTSASKEPFPGKTLPKGGGYIIKPPNKAGKWQVSTYIFNPTQVIVNKGEKVTLKILGINGSKHTVTIERYAKKPFLIKRGKLTEVSFVADKAGVFRIDCAEHPPSMTGEIIVLDN